MTDERSERIGAEYYDRSEYYEVAHLADRDSPFQRYRIRKILEIYHPGPEERVLDMGCGWGTLEWAMASRVAGIVGVDFSAKSVGICDRLRERADLPNVRFVHADAGATGLPPESFDLVIAADLFEHLYPEDSLRVAREAFRVLKPGGRFSVWTPHRGHFLEVLKNNRILLKPDLTHVDYKSMARMRGLVEEAGFRIERAYYAESHLPVLRTLERALSPVVPLLRRRVAVLGRKP